VKKIATIRALPIAAAAAEKILGENAKGYYSLTD
jgi:predicted TIM-barrel fold metal-dependent hydrolase